MSEIKTIVPKSRFRRLPKGGAVDTVKLNATIEELTHEVQELQGVHNDTFVSLLSGLPLGSDDDEFPSIGSTIDPLVNGLSGDQIWTDNTASSESDVTFYDGRKLTVKESLLKVIDKIDSNFTSIQSQIDEVDAGASAYTRDYIGLTAFDALLSSTSSSIDGRTTLATFNITQLKADTFGSPYSLNGSGTGNLTYPVQQVIDALLDQHGGAVYKSGYTYPTTITLAGISVTTDDITLGATKFPQLYTRYSTSYALKNRIGSVTTLQDDLNRLRFEVARIKSPTAGWDNDVGIAPAYDSGIVSFGEHIQEQGTGTASSSNPHGQHLNDITGWSGASGARSKILAFTGMDNINDGTPDYSAHGVGPVNFIADGDSLEKVIYDIDQVVGAISETNIIALQKDVSVSGGNDVECRGWASRDCQLTNVRAYMYGINTQGTYTFSLVNQNSEPLLDAITFNMNTLVADTVTDIDLTAYTTRLDFLEKDKWLATFSSNDVGFDGTGIYFELIFTLV